jgi:hypothetical protein
MKYALGNMLNGAGSLNPDGLSLDLQFATDKTLTARKGPTPVFTRGSTGTFVGSDGLIQSAAINAARFDHDPVTLACKGLLIEESRTNLLLRSEEFDNATYWSLARATLSADQTASPTGATTADKFVTDSSVVNNHRIDRASITLALNTVYTISVFAKASEYSGFALGIDASSPVLGVQFSLSGSGSVTAQLAGYTGTIQNFGNGWFRCTATFTSSAVLSTHRVYMYLGQNGTTFTYTGDGTSGIFIWGAQLEAGAFPTSYIPTTTASVVRSADVCSITGQPFLNMWNASEGSMLSTAQLATAAATANPFLLDFYSAVPHEWGLRFFSNNFQVVQRDGSIKDINLASLSSQPFTFAAARDSSSSAGSVYGLVVSGSGSSLNNFTGVDIGRRAGGSLYFNGHLAAIRYFRKRLPNAKLQAITA